MPGKQTSSREHSRPRPDKVGRTGGNSTRSSSIDSIKSSSSDKNDIKKAEQAPGVGPTSPPSGNKGAPSTKDTNIEAEQTTTASSSGEASGSSASAKEQEFPGGFEQLVSMLMQQLHISVDAIKQHSVLENATGERKTEADALTDAAVRAFDKYCTAQVSGSEQEVEQCERELNALKQKMYQFAGLSADSDPFLDRTFSMLRFSRL